MHSLDRARLGDDPQLVTDQANARLAALAAVLRGQSFSTELLPLHLLVSLGSRKAEVWCGSRSDDDGRLWFSKADGAPICEADDVTSAVVAVKGLLAGEG